MERYYINAEDVKYTIFLLHFFVILLSYNVYIMHTQTVPCTGCFIPSAGVCKNPENFCVGLVPNNSAPEAPVTCPPGAPVISYLVLVPRMGVCHLFSAFSIAGLHVAGARIVPTI